MSRSASVLRRSGVIRQFPRKQKLGTIPPIADRALGYTQNLGGLELLETFVIEKVENLSFLFGENLDLLMEGLPAFQVVGFVAYSMKRSPWFIGSLGISVMVSADAVRAESLS